MTPIGTSTRRFPVPAGGNATLGNAGSFTHNAGSPYRWWSRFTQGRPAGAWVLESGNVVAETLAGISGFDDS